MTNGRKPFEVIDGDATPRRETFATFDGSEWTIFECPVCRREDGVEHSQLAVIVRGVLSDGRKVSVEYATEKELVCTRCFAMKRGGLHYKPGLVAVWTEREGWVRLDKI